MEEILKVKHLNYSYPDGDGRRVIFEDASCSFELNHFYAILGESGSGKTTLLSILAGLDGRYEGEITYLGKEIKSLSLDKYRSRAVSMIYQSYNLIPHLNAIENCMIAMDISHNVQRINQKEIIDMLASIGIDEKKAKRSTKTLSGGEQQRIAIARAILCKSDIIVADEPTGNLDHANAEAIIELFEHLSKEGKCIIMVTHNEKLAAMADTILTIDQEKKKIV